MNVEKKVPEIRFKGFSGEWESIGLLDSIERIIDFRGRTPKKIGFDWSPSGYRALSALNVKQGYIDFSIDPHFGDQELYDKWMSDSELHLGQVLFTTEAPMGNVAQVPNSDKYILSQRTIAFVVKSEVVTDDFLAVLLRSPKVFRGLTALSSGGTAKGVSQKNLAKLDISLPEDLSEQTAIGNTFQKFDSLINQHQQKHDQLSNIKKAMLEKMFPKPGETIPEIRFKGFGGEWEHFTIESCSSLITKGTTPMTIGRSFVDKGVSFVKVESVDEMGNLSQSKFAYIDTETDQVLARSRIKENDLLLSIAGALGRAAIVKKKFLPANTNQALAIVRLKNDSLVEVKFLYHFTKTRDFKDFVDASASQGAQPNLSLGDISKVKIFAPTREEQTAIGNYFQKLDALINQHQQQISKLTNIKQAFLSKMFV